MSDAEEIAILKDQIEELTRIIDKMKCCATCKNLTLFDKEDPCISCGDYKNYELKEND